MSAWYSVLAMGFGYLSAAIILMIVVISVRKTVKDRRIWKRAVAAQRQLEYAGELIVLSGGSKRLPAGEVLSVPYEGTIGLASGCDVVLSIRRLHLRAAFFWVEGQRMYLVPVQKDAIEVDGELLRPGDEAVMTTGARLTVNGVSMELHLYEGSGLETEKLEYPYVTRARRIQAHRGRGSGIGSSGSVRRKEKGRKKAAENPER